MIGKISTAIALATCLAGLQFAAAPASAEPLKVLSDKTVTGFGHIESVAYDPKDKVLYTGDFGPDLKPADKDGKGFITKVSLDGKILEKKFFPPEGQTMNKPKGIWISGGRLWVTDIDGVWLIDLKTKEGKKLEMPGIVFANDPTVMNGVLYVSDNRSDQLFSVEPADFLKAKKPPKITAVFKGKGIFPNGLYPGKNGSLVMVGMESKDKPHGIYEMAQGQGPQADLRQYRPARRPLCDEERRHHRHRLGDRVGVPVEQEDGQARFGDRLQRPGRSLRHPQRQGSLGGHARSGQRRNALHPARQITALDFTN